MSWTNGDYPDPRLSTKKKPKSKAFIGYSNMMPAWEPEPGIEARRKKLFHYDARYKNATDQAELDMIARIVWAHRGGTMDELDSLCTDTIESKSPVSKVGRHQSKNQTDRAD